MRRQVDSRRSSREASPGGGLCCPHEIPYPSSSAEHSQGEVDTLVATSPGSRLRVFVLRSTGSALAL